MFTYIVKKGAYLYYYQTMTKNFGLLFLHIGYCDITRKRKISKENAINKVYQHIAYNSKLYNMIKGHIVKLLFVELHILFYKTIVCYPFENFFIKGCVPPEHYFALALCFQSSSYWYTPCYLHTINCFAAVLAKYMYDRVNHQYKLLCSNYLVSASPILKAHTPFSLNIKHNHANESFNK